MKNRTAIGIVCIILSVAVTFCVSPVVNKISVKEVEIVRLSKNIARGTQITDEDVELVEVGAKGLPSDTYIKKDDVVGKYATADLFKGDYVTSGKLAETADAAADVFGKLSGDKLAVSITIGSFAGGLSGKLENGDIVSVIATDKNGVTSIPSELKYVKVITTTTSGGVDKNEVEAKEDGSFELPATITLLVSVKQATVLASYEENATMHIALVYRGDSTKAQKFLDAQDEYLNNTDSGGAANG